MESVPADTPHCPPDVAEIAEAYCMETLDRPASLAFEDHYLVCPQCASVVASTDEYVRSMRTAMRRLRMEDKDSSVTRRTGTCYDRRQLGIPLQQLPRRIDGFAKRC